MLLFQVLLRVLLHLPIDPLSRQTENRNFEVRLLRNHRTLQIWTKR